MSSRVGCSITTSEPEQQQGNDLQSDTPTIQDGRKGAEIKGATSPKGRKAVQLGSAGSYPTDEEQIEHLEERKPPKMF